MPVLSTLDDPLLTPHQTGTQIGVSVNTLTNWRNLRTGAPPVHQNKLARCALPSVGSPCFHRRTRGSDLGSHPRGSSTADRKGRPERDAAPRFARKSCSSSASRDGSSNASFASGNADGDARERMHEAW